MATARELNPGATIIIGSGKVHWVVVGPSRARPGYLILRSGLTGRLKEIPFEHDDFTFHPRSE